MKKILVDTTHLEETVIVKLDEQGLVEGLNYDVGVVKKGNIYAARISNIDFALQAVFVNFGGNRPGFVSLSNIHEMYFENGEKTLENLNPNTLLMVQIEKEERGTKGAFLTTYISLLGRYCVFLIDSKHATGGVSKKIQDNLERERLKKIKERLQIPDGVSLILRTAGANADYTDIKRDYRALMKLWASIRKLFVKARGIKLIYEEASGVKKAIRDYYDSKIHSIKVLTEDNLKEVKGFINTFMPRRKIEVGLMTSKEMSIFDSSSFHKVLDDLKSTKIMLPSGGSISITHTEALIAIDVNSRKTRQSAFQTNLEAVVECARQILLKNLHGIIIMDLIEMDYEEEKQEVEKAFKNAMELDKARLKINKINNLGLLELSRQRIQPSVFDWLVGGCGSCTGSQVNASFLLRQACRLLYHRVLSKKHGEYRLLLSRALSNCLINEKLDFLQFIRTEYDVKVRCIVYDQAQDSFYRIDAS